MEMHFRFRFLTRSIQHSIQLTRYFTVGFSPEAAKFFLYWLFMAFSLGTFTFLGQGFMAIFRDSTTAQGFGALLIGMSSIFGGIIIRPQHMPSFWIWGA